MQNRYVGDIGDFEKYLLLKILCKDGLRLGVNWCLIEPTPEELKKGDGGSTSYLNEHDIHRGADKTLFEQLKYIVHKKNDRQVALIQKSKVLPSNTCFYDDLVLPGTKRFYWHDKSLQQFESCDIIFYDPDNGIERKSYGKLHSKAIKYTYFDEIRDAYQHGKSIVIYQHNNMNKKVVEQIKERIEQLNTCLKINESNIITVVKGVFRFYIIIKQQKHKNSIDQNLKSINDKKLSEILRVHPLQ